MNGLMSFPKHLTKMKICASEKHCSLFLAASKKVYHFETEIEFFCLIIFRDKSGRDNFFGENANDTFKMDKVDYQATVASLGHR